MAYFQESNKEIVRFAKTIPTNTTDVLAERIKSAGTIEEVRVRFYAGQEKMLQVRPFVEHKGHMIEDLMTYVTTGENYLSGDNDYFIYPISVSVDNDDYLKIWVSNTDSYFNYTLSVDVVIDYAGGRNRVNG